LGRSDDLSLTEVCRAWSKVSEDDPNVLMQRIFEAFWRGEFERHGQSVIFQLVKPDGTYVEVGASP